MAIVGASGYAGGEVARLALQHPRLEVRTLAAHSNAGQKVSDVLPHLGVDPSTVFAETSLDSLTGHDVVVLGLPHGQSGALAQALREADPGVIILDLGADFRLDDAGAWQRYYGSEHAGTWTYGMPELPRESGTQRDLLCTAREIAVPGCNASAVTFAALPLIQRSLVDPASLGAVLSVGYSGAGKTPKSHLLFSEASGGAVPYSAGGAHRHIPEIIQNLSLATGIGRDSVRLSFTPVLVPMSRGIMAVLTAKVTPGVTESTVREAFEAAYGDEPFLTLLPAGSFPNTAHVAGTNRVHLAVNLDEVSGTITVMSALDNLVKGTAGAAIQSLNLALGLDETLALPTVGLHP